MSETAYTADIQDTSCKDCPRYKGSKHVCQMEFEKEYEQGGVMAVSDYPSASDGNDATIMNGNKDYLFWKIMKTVVGADRKKIYPTYAVKCRGNGEKPIEPDIHQCKGYLAEEVFRLRPKVIILLGVTAMEAFGFKGQITKLRGNMQNMTFTDHHNEKFTTKIIVTFSPSYVENVKDSLKSFALDCAKAYSVITGEISEATTKVVKITKISQVHQLIEYVKKTKECCFDFEGTKLKDMSTFDPDFYATLLSISFQHGSAYTIPLFHFDSPFNKEEVMEILGLISKEIWQNPDIRKLNHHLKFDMHVAAKYGFPIFRGRLDDTLLMHHALDENAKHGLKSIVPQYYPQFAGWEDKIGDNWEKVPLDILSNYAGIDTDSTFRLCTVLESKLVEDDRVYQVYRNLTMFSQRALYRMEERGMPINKADTIRFIARADELIEEHVRILKAYPQVKKFDKYERVEVDEKLIAKYELQKEGKKGKNLSNIQDKIDLLKTKQVSSYKSINFSSPPQLLKLLYSADYGFKYKPIYDRKKKKVTPSTDKDVLKALDDHSGFLRDLMIFRTLKINRATFLYGNLKKLDEDDRLHTQYNQAGTVTQRLSSSKPNLQNVATHIKIDHPAVEEVVGLVKKCFIPSPGCVLMNLDYSQMEIRIAAELANEKTIIKAYNSDFDMHIVTGARLAGILIEEYYKTDEKKQKQIRSKAKAANFGLIFKQSPEGFMEYAKVTYGISMTIEEATEIHTQFFEAYPALLDYHRDQIKKGKKYGYVRTMFGSKRHLPNINGRDNYYMAEDERFAINCVTDDTEVLTDNGWKTVYNLSVNDKIHTVNSETGLIELQQCLKVNLHSIVNKRMIEIENNAVSAISTLNHRWLVDSKRTKGIVVDFITSEKLSNHGDHRIWLTGKENVAKGNGSWTDNEVRLAGWVLTDGHYLKSNRCKTKRVGVSQVKKHNFLELDFLFNQLGKHGKYTTKRGQTFWSINESRIQEIMPEKTLNMAFLKQLSSKQLKLLYKTMLKGDGSYDSHANRYRKFTTGTKERADAFLMLCAMIGQPARAVVTDTTDKVFKKFESMGNIPKGGICWHIELKQRTRAYANIGKKEIEYTGNVWCPTVKNGTWIAKRNGKVFITGNSPIQGTGGQCTIFALGLLDYRLPKSVGLLNSVHDSILLDVPFRHIQYVAQVAEYTCTTLPMKKFFGREFEKLKMKVDIEIADTNWRSLKKYVPEEWQNKL